MNIKEDMHFMTRAVLEEQSERSLQKEKKRQQFNLRMELEKHFYTYFKKYQGNTQKDMIDFYDIDIREQIIQVIGEYDGDKMTYLNSIYSKSLKKISQIFINNDKFLETQNSNATFEEICSISNDIMNMYNNKKRKNKEEKINNMILFLNLILAPFSK